MEIICLWMEELLARVQKLEDKLEILAGSQKQDMDEAIGAIGDHENRLEEMEQTLDTVRSIVYVHEVHFEGLMPTSSSEELVWGSADSSEGRQDE